MSDALNIELCFVKEKGYILSTPVGEINSENVMLTIKKAIELSNSTHCQLLLFDIRKCSPKQSMIEGFQDMKDLLKIEGLNLGHRMAIVFDPSRYPKERAEFIENVVVNRPNPSYKMFTEMEEAENWLDSFKEL